VFVEVAKPDAGYARRTAEGGCPYTKLKADG
jgi:hypothetical protein